MKYLRLLLMVSLLFILSSPLTEAKKSNHSSHKETKPQATTLSVPNSVVNIGKENTYPNATQDVPYLQPSDFTNKIINESKVKIENPGLIRMLNESSVNNSPFVLGFRATVYLGEWPLNYQSNETSPNWQYQKINTNFFDNRGGKENYKIHYVQEVQKIVRGGLTAKVSKSEDVRQMMLLKAMEKTKLPLAFDTVIGAGTKNDQVYHVGPKKLGYLYGYAPAVNEKGKVTYGEVYLNIKGRKKSIVVKNVTSQGIGAWIPVQDHVSFSFASVDQPK